MAVVPSTSLVPTSIDGARAARARLDDLARRLVHARLEGLAQGAVTVHEAGRATRLGRGEALHAHVVVHDPGVYAAVALGGSLGAAEAFVDGLWSSPDPVTVCRVLLREEDTFAGLDGPLRLAQGPLRWVDQALRRNTREGSRRNIHAHYDLGNEFFSLFLDETLSYSSAVFPRPDASLREASEHKLDLVCAKLDLGPDDHLLEIGTGWGGLALHAARTRGCRVTTATISREQHREARARVLDAGLEDRVQVLLADYRDLQGTYDKVVSIEMIEAVGHEYLPEYFRVISDRLAPGGRALIQAITTLDHRYERSRRSVDFIKRHIFPGGQLPSVGAMSAAWAQTTRLSLVGLEDITPHYARTLREWRSRFGERLEEVRAQGFDERFLRTWDFYLASCEAGFAERFVRTAQLVLEKPGAHD